MWSWKAGHDECVTDFHLPTRANGILNSLAAGQRANTKKYV